MGPGFKLILPESNNNNWKNELYLNYYGKKKPQMCKVTELSWTIKKLIYLFKIEQKQPSGKALWKYSLDLQENTMPKCDFNKVANQLYWNHIAVWVFCCKFATYFQNTFSKEHLWRTASDRTEIGVVTPECLIDIPGLH